MDSTSIYITWIHLSDTSKMHVGMLSLSLIVGLAYGGFTAYCCWVKENILLSHIRNLVIALTCRTFFTLLVHAVVIIQGSKDVAGGNTLLAFESITLNLVMSFWLFLTLYLHARVQSNCNSEPNLTLYQYGIPVVGVFFAFVWIFVMEGDASGRIWFQLLYLPLWSSANWITNSIQLLYLLIQLGLVSDMGRMLMKYSLDSDATMLSRKIAGLLVAMVLMFWLEFGFRVGKPTSDGYLYFYYLIAGLQCAGLCPIFYIFEKWVFLVLNKIPHVPENVAETGRTRHHESDDVQIDSGLNQGIVTIESLLTAQDIGNGRRERQIIEERKDVVYSSVVQPENLKKTIDLYKRFNVIPKNDVTIIGGEEFYECQSERKGSDISEISDSTLRNFKNNINRNINTVNLDKVKKKNAFYSSKYLIVEPKEKHFLKYLEKRSSISSTEEGSIKECKRRTSNYSNSGKAHLDERVKNWLNDSSVEPKSNNQTNSSRQYKTDPDSSSRSSTKMSETSETPNRMAESTGSRTPSIGDNDGQKTLNRPMELNDPSLSKNNRSSNV